MLRNSCKEYKGKERVEKKDYLTFLGVYFQQKMQLLPLSYKLIYTRLDVKNAFDEIELTHTLSSVRH